ncbi:winged helix-turn-helix transcriptional regulator [Stenotrophomonas maltophilia]|jgi:DNA-binding HxlR family transcriptional regulator|uniref:winged helix-turn-helix transcriptional regulator n=1 Tax=Stenotrophomonas maltophilia TaxID=40324 RepID=UPI001F339121|nr:helix-turn-helix domain-containing protein [Stenotrophomonas maltophilia]
MSTDDDGLRREVLAHAGSRWSLGIIHALGVYGTLRHADVARRMKGITQRMLTRTLRQLERDGLIYREDFREVPPRVEYSITPLGKDLLVLMIPMWTWVVQHAEEFRQCREIYDSNHASLVPDSPRDNKSQ